MSPANVNVEQFFAAAKNLPGELSLQEVELMFLNPAPLPPARPWYRSYLKFFAMLSFLLAVVLTVTVVTATENPILTTFPVAVAITTPPSATVSPTSTSPVINELAEAPVSSVLPTLNSSVQLPDNTALSPEPAPAAAPKPVEDNTLGPEILPLVSAPIPNRKAKQREQQPKEISTPSPPPPSTVLPSQKAALDPFSTTESASTTSRAAEKKEPTEAFVPIKWGLEQAGYMSDTIMICSRNDRSCTMQLKLKGKFRLKLNPEMSEKYMILYARPEAIAAMVTKHSFRKMTLRNLLKDQAIDVEINPKGLVGLRLKENVELIDHEE